MTAPAPLTLGALLDEAAERYPDTTAVVFRGARVSYRELRERADRFARGLLGLGLGPGDHVVVWNFYLRNPKILDISIVGVPDPVLGEVPMAFVIPRAGATLTAEEVVEFARGKIANFKVPRHVEIVTEFPLTGSGKVQKFKQKAAAIETYGFTGPK